ncbi:uncharacterized protein TNCT_706171 [Trichonephila clavata]|uniref:Ankyrin repeat protein n=1 Tax=Trichonephila clavata TaxID=2740835 RepID=A0A8X6JRV7_TRICU|nr:uncharacterized protein TNCT_706171 [Trichonephila clavata]
MDGGVPNKELNEELRNILDQLESNRGLLDNFDNIKYIISLLEAGADQNIRNQNGKTLLDYLNKKLSDILESNGDPLSNIQHIILLLEAGANPNVQNQDGKTLLHYLNKKLLGILDELEQNIVALSDHGYIQRIIGLLQVGADPNTKGQNGKTPLDYLNEELLNILNQLAIDSNLLDNSNNTQYIMSLLQAGANPNVQNQAGKALLHYVAERNDINGIRYFLGVIKANPSIRDQSGKTPFEYVTEPDCLQALKDLGYISNDKTTCTKLSDSEKNSGYYSDGSCENEEGPAKSPNNENWTSTDQQTSSEFLGVSNSSDSEDSEDSSDCDDIDHYDTSCGTRHSHLRYDKNIDIIRKKDSFSLAKIKLNKVEIEKYESVWQKIYKIHDDLDKTCDKSEDYYKKCEEEFDEVISQALKQGVMFTFPCKNDESFVDLMISTLQKLYFSYDTTRIPEFIERTKMSHIISGGATLNEFTQENHDDFVNIICKDEDILSQRDKSISRLNNLAYESIVNKSKQTHEYDFKAEIDNGYFCIEYPRDSIIDPAKIFNKAEALDLKVGIIKIGESIVRVEGTKDGKKNCTDILKGRIKMSFTTEVGKISIYLSPSKKDGNKIEVEIDEENKAKFNKLKDKSSLGKNCLLEGKSVLEAIEAKGFKKNGNVPTESIKTIKDDLSTNLTQVRLQQNREVALGG